MSHRFRVWAPWPPRLGLVRGADRREMAWAADGWRQLEVAEAAPRTQYWFQPYERPLPDPRSPYQPEGVHGPSELVDHATFPWTDAGWAGLTLDPRLVLYELHVGTFTPAGTFDSAVERLDHLVDLGIGAVELMPVAEFAGNRGWGYDGVDLYAPHHAYGGPSGLKRFVDACHGRGLAVVLDVVYNHLGPEGNYLSQFGPYFSQRYRSPWGPAVNLDDFGSDEVRRFIVDNALMWAREYHVDGFRLDAVQELVDRSAVHLLEELAASVHAAGRELGKPLFLIAESDLNQPRLVQPPEEGGYGLDAQWNDDFHHALHALLSGERTGYYADYGSIADLVKAIQRGYVYEGQHSAFRQRRHGRPFGTPAGSRLVVYSQNHDQVGNRAAGERTSQLLGPGKLKIAAALVLTAPYIALLFQGEEWGAGTPFQYFTDLQDPELARGVSEGRRHEFAAFGWRPEDVPDPQAPETFDRSRLDWAEPAREPHLGLLGWYRELIRLRRRPELAAGRAEQVDARFDEAARWLLLRRGDLTVACNFSDRPVSTPAGGQMLLASQPPRFDEGRLELPPESVVILRS